MKSWYELVPFSRHLQHTRVDPVTIVGDRLEKAGTAMTLVLRWELGGYLLLLFFLILTSEELMLKTVNVQWKKFRTRDKNRFSSKLDSFSYQDI